jgi:metallophosphoesterase (TIGR00282 family)
MAIRIVMLGDIVGSPGRNAVVQLIPAIRQRWRPDLVIVNAENAASGSGLMPEQYQKLRDAGVDGVTLGDHVYKRIQIVPTLEREPNIIRPANLPGRAKGRRWMVLNTKNRNPDRASLGQEARDVQPGGVNVYVLTVLGRLHATLPVDEPFAVIEQVLAQLPEKNPLVVVEVHADFTSEKQAIGWYFDGRVAAVLGTHTHVPTADARILPGGTAYMTDLGMCGPYASVIGRRADRVLEHLTSGMPAPFDVATGDPRICGVMVEIDERSRRATAIERVELNADPNAPPFMAGGRDG